MAVKDLHIWEQYTRGVEPKRGKKPVVPDSAAKNATRKASRPPALPPGIATKPGSDKSKPLPSPTFERKREKALRQGDIDIDATIDLHGMTQEKAFAALAKFLCRAIAAGRRNLLVITGKGQDGEGVLRRSLKHWLETMPEAKHIMAFRPAGIKHGGTGAFYVLLKKSRPAL